MTTAREEALTREVERLRRINAALIERVEAGTLPRSAPYAAFEHTALLAEQVRERTWALNQTLHELRSSNRLLAEARERAERASQTLVDAIESITDAFVLFDADLRIERFNRRFAELWLPAGIRVRRGMTLDALRHRARSSGLVVREWLGKEDRSIVYQLHDGRWLQVHQRPTRGGGRVVLHVDITELKRQESAQREHALAEKSRLLQATLDSLSQGVAVVAADGCLEMCNRRCLALAGLTAPLATGGAVPLERLGPLVAGLEVRSLAAAREQHLPDGRIVEVRGHPMPGGGRVLTFTDITERTHYAQTLLERERWIRTITDELPVMIAYLNRDLRYAFVNRGYEHWYGWPRGRRLGGELHELHSEAHCRRLIPYLERVLQGESLSFELAETGASGEERVLLRSYVPHRNGDDGVIGVFVLVRDITERRRATEALRHAYQNLEQRVRERTAELTRVNRQLRAEIHERTQAEQRLREAKTEAEAANLSKTKFLAAVSHDLLQPLNAARLFVGALEEQVTTSQGGELVGLIGRSLKDVESLLATLVDSSRLDAGVITPDIGAFPVAELLDGLAREYRQVAASEGLELRHVPCRAVVVSDISLLGRVLRNFLSNAVRYTVKGRLLLGCRRRPHGLEIQVGDSGIGIEEAEQAAIFQEFRRLDGPVRSDRGLGLGLSIADKISRILDHPLRVRSRVGAGSLFSITLPYGEIAAAPGAAALPAPPAGRVDLAGCRVWVVDNDSDICHAMKTLLERWECRVWVAESEAALSAQLDLAEAAADVLIVDYHLDHGETGLAVAERINARRRDPLAVMAITANHSNALRQQVRALGYQLLHKPVKPLRLRLALAQLVTPP